MESSYDLGDLDYGIDHDQPVSIVSHDCLSEKNKAVVENYVRRLVSV